MPAIIAMIAMESVTSISVIPSVSVLSRFHFDETCIGAENPPLFSFRQDNFIPTTLCLGILVLFSGQDFTYYTPGASRLVPHIEISQFGGEDFYTCFFFFH